MGIALAWESRRKQSCSRSRQLPTKRSGYWFSRAVLSPLGRQIIKGKWDEERRTHEGARFVVDLTKLTIVSQHGENILFQMFTDGARLVGNSLLARVVIQQVERRRNLQYQERKDNAGRRTSLAVGIGMLLVLAGRLSWASTWRPPHATSDGRSIERVRTERAADHSALDNVLGVMPQMPRGPR
jgi:hypothetical protein